MRKVIGDQPSMRIIGGWDGHAEGLLVMSAGNVRLVWLIWKSMTLRDIIKREVKAYQFSQNRVPHRLKTPFPLSNILVHN